MGIVFFHALAKSPTVVNALKSKGITQLSPKNIRIRLASLLEKPEYKNKIQPTLLDTQSFRGLKQFILTDKAYNHDYGDAIVSLTTLYLSQALGLNLHIHTLPNLDSKQHYIPKENTDDSTIELVLHKKHYGYLSRKEPAAETQTPDQMWFGMAQNPFGTNFTNMVSVKG